MDINSFTTTRFNIKILREKTFSLKRYKRKTCLTCYLLRLRKINRSMMAPTTTTITTIIIIINLISGTHFIKLEIMEAAKNGTKTRAKQVYFILLLFFNKKIIGFNN